MLLSALAVGAKGAIGSTYTFAAPIYHQVIKLYNEGKLELAAKWQLHSVNMVRCLVKYPPIPAQRAIMQIKGMELGDCRLPLEPLSANDTLAFKAELTEIGFFDLIA
jgi:N-acetylneuraminate lyase